MDRFRRIAGYPAELLLAAVSALIAAVLVAIGFGLAWPLKLDVGAGDARFVSGFNAVETIRGIQYRWTTANATIAMPQLPDGQAGMLTLRVLNGRPTGQPDLHMQLSANGEAIGALTLPPSYERVYRMMIPPSRRLDWATRIVLQSDTITLPDDPRPLGGGVDWVRLEVMPSVVPLLPIWLLLWSLGMGALGYALLRSIGRSRPMAVVGSVALAALIALGIAARPLEVLPFVQRVPALLGLGCLGVWLARLLVPPVLTTDPSTTRFPSSTRGRAGDRPFDYAVPELDEGQGRRPTTDELGRKRWSVVGGRWSVRGIDLPIFMAIAWWLAPLFQLVQTADGATSVIPPPATLWIGAALLLGLAGLGAWYALRGRLLPSDQAGAAIACGALAIFAAVAAAHLGYMIWYAFQRQGPDFWILFKGARDWARGGSLYDLEAVRTNHFGHVFKVPPFYGMLFVPWVFQDGERILFFHRVLNCILIGTTALVWLRMWGLRFFSLAAASLLILLNFRPMTDTMAFGQIDLALLLVLTLALWALRADRDVLAGVLIALGTLFKIYPVLLLAFLVVKRRWWGLAGFALGMLLFNGVAVAVMGWEMHRVYLTEVFPSIGGTTSWVENQTISGFLARFVAPPTESEIFKDRALALLGLGISALVGLAGCVLVLPPARSRDTTFALQYSLFPLLMVLVVPAAWMHYETLLFLPFAVMLQHMADREVSLPAAAALALSFALIGYGNQWSFYDGTVMGVLTIAGVSYKFYGMLLLGGVLATTLLAERAPAWADVSSFLTTRRRGAGMSAPLPPG